MLPVHSGRQPGTGKPRIFFPPPSPTSGSNSASFFSIIGQQTSSLRGRSRITNLTALLLGSALVASLLLNLLHYSPLSGHYFASSRTGSWRPHRPAQHGWDDAATPLQHGSGLPLSIETTIERDPRYADLDHLVMVPGHAIWTGSENDIAKVGEDGDWILQPIQKGGAVKTFVKHIEEGVRVLKEDPGALLVFSGGATRSPPAPLLTEAYSYRSLASYLSLLPSTPLPSNSTGYTPLPLDLRATGEEFALDSYENLLFSLARFREVTTRYPSKITVVGYGMKSRRFTDLHRAAIGWPRDQWNYIGIDDEGDTSSQYSGEEKYGYIPFLSSPSGCHPPLSIKRTSRNPFFRYHPYHVSCPELVDLLEWCPPRRGEVGSAEEMQVFEGKTPWKEDKKGGWGREKW